MEHARAIKAMDGKHLKVMKPKVSDSKYFNYKHFFSVILMALVDSDYQFRWIGQPWRMF